MTKSSNSGLEQAVYQLLEVYKTDPSEHLVSELRSFRHEFLKEIENDSKTVLDILKLLISSGIISSMPELATACALFLVLPVTVSSAERSFSKLKIIKTYLRSTISQARLDGLALLSIEAEESKKIDIDEVISTFAQKNLREEHYKSFCKALSILCFNLRILNLDTHGLVKFRIAKIMINILS